MLHTTYSQPAVHVAMRRLFRGFLLLLATTGASSREDEMDALLDDAPPFSGSSSSSDCCGHRGFFGPDHAVPSVGRRSSPGSRGAGECIGLTVVFLAGPPRWNGRRMPTTSCRFSGDAGLSHSPPLTSHGMWCVVFHVGIPLLVPAAVFPDLCP